MTPILIVLAVAAALNADGSSDAPMLRREFLNANRGAKFVWTARRVSGVFGAEFGGGQSPTDAGGRFCGDWARILGAEPTSLRAGNAVTGDVTQPVMYDAATDSYKFTLVYYRQFVGDVPVHGRELRVLTRNVQGFPVVWARSSLADLGDFTLDPNATPLSRAELETHVRALRPNMTTIRAPRQVVWAGTEEEPAPPRLAFELEVDNLDRADRRAADEVWSFMLDAFSGNVLQLESRILHDTLTGTTKAYATENYRAGECVNEALVALPYATVDVDVNADGTPEDSKHANKNGAFLFINTYGGPVTVRSHLSGKWFKVNDPETETCTGCATCTYEILQEDDVDPDGTVDFVHNASGQPPGDGCEFLRAQANAYIHANLARDTALAANPLYPVIHAELDFLINVNRGSGCGSTYHASDSNYSGVPSINFDFSESGCNNLAFGDVVHHEYGHHLVQVAGSTPGEYAEGAGDVMGILATDHAIFAEDWYDCGSEARDPVAADCQYNPDGCPDCEENTGGCSTGCERHCGGMLLSGCVWDVREALVADQVPDYQELLRDLAINSFLMHVGSRITPHISIDWLTLDDDDGDLSNGTPHSASIGTGFGYHDMVPDVIGGTNGGLTVFTWTDAAATGHEWYDPCNWRKPNIPSCASGDYPDDAPDVAMIDNATSNTQIDLTSVTINKLAVGRDMIFSGGASVNVDAFVVNSLSEVGGVVEVEVDSSGAATEIVHTP